MSKNRDGANNFIANCWRPGKEALCYVLLQGKVRRKTWPFKDRLLFAWEKKNFQIGIVKTTWIRAT